jgi:hypothetical protein
MYGGLIDPDTGWESWEAHRFTRLWQTFVDRWRIRDERMNLIARVVRGDWTVLDANAKLLSAKSPNVIQVGLEDTAAAASMIPTPRVYASDPADPESERQASQMELLGASYLKRAGGKLLFQKSSLTGGAFGLACWQVVNDGEKGKTGSVPQWRDPAGCYPEPDVNEIGVASRMFHTRDVYLSQLDPHYARQFLEHCNAEKYDATWFDDHSVKMLEYSDANRVTIGLAYDSSKSPRDNGYMPYMDGQSATWVSVIVDDYPNKAGMCRGIYGQWPSLDGEPRGQFDQVVPVLHSHMRLVAMALEHAAQSVYNELVVVDPIGEVPQGPDAVIELGAQGKAFRLPPATVAFSFFEETNRLLDAVHVGARWPRNRTGEVSQSQASGKFVETSLGVQNAVIGTHHTVLERMTNHAVNVCLALDKAEGPRRKMAGVLRNQQFASTFDRKHIDLAAEVCVEYGLGYGRDVSQSAVIALQLVGGKMISVETAQENYPGITDVARERSRLLAEEIQLQMKGELWMAVQAKEVSSEQLADMLVAVQRGMLFVEAYRKYIVEPKKQREAQMLTSGLTGAKMMPGAAPMQGPGGQMPTAPNPADVLGMLGGGGAAPSQMSRLSVPLGDGSFAGSTMGG